MFTNFPNGITSYGNPLPGMSLLPANGVQHLFVNSFAGSDGFQGDSWDNPLLTIGRAFQLAKSGCVIHLLGNFREQLTTPVGIFDVTLVGEQTQPRNADAHTVNNGYYATTWKAPAAPVAATPLCKVLQQGWRFINILFNAPADAAAVQLYRDGGAGDAERDASHASFFNCRFTGGQDGIQIIECAFVLIQNCFFYGMTASAIKSTAGAGIALPLCTRIVGNYFMNNANHVVVAMNYGMILENLFGVSTTPKYIDLTGGGGNCVITKNYLFGTYSVAGGYIKSAASDEWAGNWNTLAGGITVADPA